MRFTWAYDFFSSPPLKVDGWAGTLRAGELLYMPGDGLVSDSQFKLNLKTFKLNLS